MADDEGQVQRAQGPHAAPGPLVVSRANPRYFAVAPGATGEERLVYLTGSHINNNLHDGLGFGPDCPDTPERFDYGALSWPISPSV